MLRVVGLLSLLINNYPLINGANILAISTLASPSHHHFHHNYLFTLAEQGHNVTFLSHDVKPVQHSNYTQILLEGAYEVISDSFNPLNLKYASAFELNLMLWTFHDVLCECDFKSNGLQTLESYPDNFKFDLIIWDIWSGACLFPLIEKFGNPPVIGTSPYINQPDLYRSVYQSYRPHALFSYTDKMSIWERFHSNFWNMICLILRHFYFRPNMIKLAEKHFGKTTLTYDEFEKNISIILTNYNPISNFPEVLPPNIIPVGGIHIRPRELNKEFKEILNNAKNGAILISFGTNVKAKDLNQEKVKAVLLALSKLKQIVIWKLDDDLVDLDVPKNVYLKKWVPQLDLLNHPNTILFITHCGLLSTQEIFFTGIPIIGVPFFLDQLSNAAVLEARGMGELIDFDKITSDNLFHLINKIISNTTYQETAKKLSKLYRDVPNKPLDSALWWTDYILKYGTASHLNLATRDMNFIQLYNLDLILGPFLALILIGVTLKCIICRCIRSKEEKKIKIS